MVNDIIRVPLDHGMFRHASLELHGRNESGRRLDGSIVKIKYSTHFVSMLQQFIDHVPHIKNYVFHAFRSNDLSTMFQQFIDDVLIVRQGELTGWDTN